MDKQGNFSFDYLFLWVSGVAPFFPVSHASPARLYGLFYVQEMG
jgi:hypothetical protein